MFEAADDKAAVSHGVIYGLLTDWVKTLAGIATPIAAVVMFFRQQLGAAIKADTATAGWRTQLLALIAKALVWIAGAALPLLIWVAYLYLSYWGIINVIPTNQAPAACSPAMATGTVNVDRSGSSCGNFDIKLKLDGCPACPATTAVGPRVVPGEKLYDGSHTPPWLLTSANFISRLILRHQLNRPMWFFYFFIGVALFCLSFWLTPNANSLHRLYRDRLSKAFLFDPSRLAEERAVRRNETSRDQGRDFAPLDTLRISGLSAEHAPYQLINAALNIQGSDYANRRGRNADFFIFSPLFIGSRATDYAPTAEFEQAVPHLDLATALAISGAAASSNMGANTIRPLTPTLALLNVRLGYWLKNPRFFSPSAVVNPDGGHRRPWLPAHRSMLFLWSEISGRLYENADEVYLTDGGHIENLGVYELLRRRCRLIIAVDAEADPAMHFPSLVTLERYARIDFGVRIDLPWDMIQKTTLAWMAGPPAPGSSSEPPRPTPGPHVAIGKIDYGDNQVGLLIYVKSSLSGDENDYIRDYARRYRLFPHESTGDQFFSEEQFEVYRALGFHMVHNALCGQDNVQVVGAAEGGIKLTDQNDTVTQVRTLLFS
jgi:hypothetical protein